MPISNYNPSTRGKTIYQGLDKIPVFINDRSENSNTYFIVSEIPDQLTSGKNSFKISGNISNLVANTNINIELLDNAGKPIYIEYEKPTDRTGRKTIAIYINQDTTPGEGTLTIVGIASRYNHNGSYQQIPQNWAGIKNIKWQRKIKIEPLERNITDISFNDQPTVEITELFKPLAFNESIYQYANLSASATGKLIAGNISSPSNDKLSNDLFQKCKPVKNAVYISNPLYPTASLTKQSSEFRRASTDNSDYKIITSYQSDILSPGGLGIQPDENNAYEAVSGSMMIKSDNVYTQETHSKFGYLYNYYAFSKYDSSSFWLIANDGWRTPDDGIMYQFFVDFMNSAGRLKEDNLNYWSDLSELNTNDTWFNARGTGYREGAPGASPGTFQSIKQECVYRTVTGGDSFPGNPGISITNGSNNVAHITVDQSYGLPIRLLKLSTTLSNGQRGQYIGNDGKKYNTVCINNIEWLAEDLRETKFRNGDIIPYEGVNTGYFTDIEWLALGASQLAGRCVYDNDETNATELQTSLSTTNQTLGITSDMVGGIIKVQNNDINFNYTLPAGYTYYASSSGDFISEITKINNAGLIEVSPSYIKKIHLSSIPTDQVTPDQLIDQYIPEIKFSSFEVTHSAKSTYSSIPLYQNAAKVKISNLTPSTGDIYKLKVYAKSSYDSENWKLIKDKLIDGYNLLIDSSSIECNKQLGIFDDLSYVNTKWTSSAVDWTADVHLNLDNSLIIQALRIGSSTGSAVYNNAGYIKTYPINNNQPFNINVVENQTYEFVSNIGYDIVPNILSPSVTGDLTMHVVISGSAVDPIDIIPSVNGVNGREIGKLIVPNATISKKFGRISFLFKPDRSGLLSPIIISNGGRWHISDTQINVVRESGLSPNVQEFEIPVYPNKDNDELDFKIEFTDYKGNVADQYVVVKNIPFVYGPSTYIQGNNNVLTGSLHAIGTINLTGSLNASGTMTLNGYSVVTTNMTQSASADIYTISASLSGSTAIFNRNDSNTYNLDLSSLVSPGTVIESNVSMSNRIILSGSTLLENANIIERRLTVMSGSYTLPSQSWASTSQSISVTGVTSTNEIFWDASTLADNILAGRANLFCSAQASSSLTFQCVTIPTSDINIKVTIR